MGLHVADIVALIIYFIVIAIIGIRSARYVHSLADFVMPRRFGKLFMMMHSFGTNTHSDQAVSVASKTYTTGLSGIWYQFMWLFATPFYWLIAPMMRRFRALTTADVFEARFSRSVAMLFVVVGLGKFMITIAVMLKGSGKIQAIDTSYGTLSGIICWDTNYPGIVRQVGVQSADILLSPAKDWPAINPLHAEMAVFRAIENGVAVVRQSDEGLSIVVDAYGRTLATGEGLAATGTYVRAEVPTRGTRTLYPVIGDLVGLLSVLGFAIVAVYALFVSWRARRREATPTTVAAP